MTEGCNHPECDETATEAYVDGNGNGLSLCPEHYFEAVYPGSVVSRVVSDGPNGRPESMLDNLFGGGQT